jgi:hypothetical protein
MGVGVHQIDMINWRKIRWEDYVAHMGVMRCVQCLARKSEGKKETIWEMDA